MHQTWSPQKERMPPSCTVCPTIMRLAERELRTSDKVAQAFLYHPPDVLVTRKEVNFPTESRIPGLVDMDRATLNA